ncbi:MAG: CvpA family protein [Patescibacteria group bacterium]|nr:CvpA family protein [Patescibacteria group bacterium]
MTLFDVILIVCLAGFVFYGLFFGIVQTLGGLFGVFAGALIASRIYEPIAGLFEPFFWGNENMSKVVCFIIIFILINRLVGLLFHILDKIFGFLKIIPFMKSISSLLGGLVGFIEGAFLLGGILYVASRYPIIDWLNQWMVDSSIAHYLVMIFNLISPLLPEAVRQIQSLI